jgi:hypothetical protein
MIPSHRHRYRRKWTENPCSTRLTLIKILLFSPSTEELSTLRTNSSLRGFPTTISIISADRFRTFKQYFDRDNFDFRQFESSNLSRIDRRFVRCFRVKTKSCYNYNDSRFLPVNIVRINYVVKRENVRVIYDGREVLFWNLQLSRREWKLRKNEVHAKYM